MTTMALVLNCGSSSLKYGLFVVKGSDLEDVCQGLVDKIGLDGCVIKHEEGDKSEKISGMLKDHGEALNKVVELLTRPGGPVKSVSDIKVVGHRVVHGGPFFSEPTIVTEQVEATLETVNPLAPLHNPANLLGIRTARTKFPVQQVAIFDTAFHATMPPESFRYAVPKELYEKHNVRRYGFHGTSYKYVSAATAASMGRPLSELNMIICHLGNGCSMACLKNGKVVDTTMGLTPLEGLMMGTRCGDADLGVYTYLCNELKMSAKDVDTTLNKKSGLLGVAGISDMREVISKAAAGNEDSSLARKMYVERVRKYLGAYLVKLNGKLDALVFTAGVGENDKAFRELATEGLEGLGIAVDKAKNRAAKGAAQIDAAASKCKVFVIPTQEELCIAQQSLEVCGIIKAQGYKAPLQAKTHPTKLGAPAMFLAALACAAMVRAS